MICEYCNSYIPDDILKCPNCGAENPIYKEREKKLLEERKAKMRVKLAELSKKEERLKNEYEDKVKQKQLEELQVLSNVKLSALCSIVTSISITTAFQTGLDHSISFMTIFIIFWILNFFGNFILFSIISNIKDRMRIKLVACFIFCILGCIMFAV